MYSLFHPLGLISNYSLVTDFKFLVLFPDSLDSALKFSKYCYFSHIFHSTMTPMAVQCCMTQWSPIDIYYVVGRGSQIGQGKERQFSAWHPTESAKTHNIINTSEMIKRFILNFKNALAQILLPKTLKMQSLLCTYLLTFNAMIFAVLEEIKCHGSVKNSWKYLMHSN